MGGQVELGTLMFIVICYFTSIGVHYLCLVKFLLTPNTFAKVRSKNVIHSTVMGEGGVRTF